MMPGSIIPPALMLLYDEADAVSPYRFVGIGLAAVIFLSVIWLIKKRRLRGEFGWLWLITGVGYFVLAVWNELLEIVASALGISPPSTALFFFGLIFLTAVAVELSVRISKQSEQIKNLAQQLAILEAERTAAEVKGDEGGGVSEAG